MRDSTRQLGPASCTQTPARGKWPQDSTQQQALTASQSHALLPLLGHSPLGLQVSPGVEGSAQHWFGRMHMPAPQSLNPGSHWLQMAPLVHDAQLGAHVLQVPSPEL